MRNIAGCACAGNAGNVFPRRQFQRKPLVSDPGMHHGTCVTHVPWCMSGSLTCGDGERVPGIPGACAPAILRIWQDAHGLLPFRRQTITLTNTGLFSICLLGTNASGIRIGVPWFPLKKCIWNCGLPTWRPFSAGGDEWKSIWVPCWCCHNTINIIAIEKTATIVLVEHRSDLKLTGFP